MPTRTSVVVSAMLLLFATLGVGCASPKGNSSFAVSTSDAQRVLHDMRGDPKPLSRPLVVLAGFFDPGVASGHLRKAFKELTGDDRVIGVSFLFCGDFDDCRRQVIAAVDKAFPSDDPEWTTEVDVVGVSMGGLVGRYAAAPVQPAAPSPKGAGDGEKPQQRRLRVARLFTIGTPHRGASLATLPTLSRLQLDMRAGSEFLRRLDDAGAAAEYEVYPYVRLGDVIVGAANAAPQGRDPWWVPGEPLQDSHMMAMMDARIIADVARRLRGEAPLTTHPPQPLPGAAPPDGAPADAAPAVPPAHAHAAADPTAAPVDTAGPAVGTPFATP
jgi:hypothetical protein